MTVGDPNVLAIRCHITRAYERKSFLALGSFEIQVGGLSYGKPEPDSSMLARSYDEVSNRLQRKGKHTAQFAGELDAATIARAFRESIYGSNPRATYFGYNSEQLSDIFYSQHLIWAPDGDEAFDDGSFVLQFDIQDCARLIAFKSHPPALLDPNTLRDVTLPTDTFYGILQEWRDEFLREWTALPKVPEGDDAIG